MTRTNTIIQSSPRAVLYYAKVCIKYSKPRRTWVNMDVLLTHLLCLLISVHKWQFTWYGWHPWHPLAQCPLIVLTNWAKSHNFFIMQKSKFTEMYNICSNWPLLQSIKGPFNNYEDIMLPFFDTPHSFWTLIVDKNRLFDPPPPHFVHIIVIEWSQKGHMFSTNDEYFCEFWFLHYEKIMRFSPCKTGEHIRWAPCWNQYSYRVNCYLGSEISKWRTFFLHTTVATPSWKKHRSFCELKHKGYLKLIKLGW